MYGIDRGRAIADESNAALSAFAYWRYRLKALPAQRTAEGGSV